ncbi:MAG: type II toxin-antitoxin system HicA family toxin [Fimbriimonadaceae bacterium]
MAKLPVCSGAEAVKAFQRLGWSVARQSASHIVLVKSGRAVTLSVPNHRTLATGTLRALIRLASLTVEEFAGALRP